MMQGHKNIKLSSIRYSLPLDLTVSFPDKTENLVLYSWHTLGVQGERRW